MDAALIIAFFVLQIVGLLLIPLGLPGTYIQLAAAIALTLASSGRYMNWLYVGVFIALALVGEVIEFLAGQWGARRFGGSKTAAWGALIGGIVGAVVGGIPVPIVGGVIAAFVGTFVGALLGEMKHQRTLQPNLRVGMGALLGRILSVAVKMGLSLVVIVLSAAAVYFGVQRGAGETDFTPPELTPSVQKD